MWGKGTRLRPQIEEVPKTLVKINGKPILEHNINFYSNKGHKKFILCVGYKGELIIDYIKNQNSTKKISILKYHRLELKQVCSKGFII